MTAKQAAKAYEKVAHALEEVEALIQQLERESSDSARGDYDFDPSSSLESNLREWTQEMYAEAETVKQDAAKEATE